MSTKEVVLVTGATGLLGQDLVQRLASQNEVHAITRQAPAQVVPGVRYHVIDLATDWNVTQLPSQADRVIHLAQSSHFREVPEKSLDVFQVNVGTTAKLLDYAWRANARQFLFASSGGVYGAGSEAFHENSPIVPPGQLGYYLGSKLCGEVLAQSYAAHLQVLVLRFFFIYGPGQNRSMLIPRLIDYVRTGRPVMLQGPDGIRINPIYVNDASRALMAAMSTAESATFNVAGSELMTLRQIVQEIGTAVGNAPIFETSATAGRDLIGDNRAMRERLHEPEVGFASGISRVTGGDLAGWRTHGS